MQDLNRLLHRPQYRRVAGYLAHWLFIRHEYQDSTAVVDARSIGCGDGSILLKDGRSVANFQLASDEGTHLWQK